MRGRIRRFLNLSLPHLLTLKYSWVYLIVVFGYVFLSLLNHLPFYDPAYPYPNRTQLLLGYGCICPGLYIIIYLIFPRIFKKYLDINRWTMGQEIQSLICLFLAALVTNGLYSLLNIPMRTDPHIYFLSVLHISFSANLLPILYVTSFKCAYFHVRKKLDNDEQPIEIPEPVAQYEAIVDLTSLKGKKYPADDIRYFQVIGNYVYIYYYSTGKIKKDELQTSLLKVKNLLKGHPQFVKCHNNQMVNTKKIMKCEGNSRKMILKLENYADKLPVSRNHMEEIKNIVDRKPKMED